MDASKKYFGYTKVIGREDVSSCKILAVALHEGEIILAYLVGSDTGIKAANAKLKLQDKLIFEGSYMIKGGYKCESFDLLRSYQESMNQNYGLFLNRKLTALVPGSNYTYVLAPVDVAQPFEDEETVKIIGQRLTQIVSVAILPEWYEPIIRRARTELDSEALIFKPTSQQCTVWAVRNAPERWAHCVSSLLKEGKIKFPKKEAA